MRGSGVLWACAAVLVAAATAVAAALDEDEAFRRYFPNPLARLGYDAPLGGLGMRVNVRAGLEECFYHFAEAGRQIDVDYQVRSAPRDSIDDAQSAQAPRTWCATAGHARRPARH
jgi:hypothetical protein